MLTLSPLRHHCRASQFPPINGSGKSTTSSILFSTFSGRPFLGAVDSITNPLWPEYSGLSALCPTPMIADYGEQVSCKFYDSIANDTSRLRAKHRSAPGIIQSNPQGNIPQSYRKSYLDASPLGIYPVYLSSSPLRLRSAFVEQLSDWPPDFSKIEPFAPTGFLKRRV